MIFSITKYRQSVKVGSSSVKKINLFYLIYTKLNISALAKSRKDGFNIKQVPILAKRGTIPCHGQTSGTLLTLYELACVDTNLNELLMRYVATVKCLLIVHKAWKFRLLDLLATQHQHAKTKHAIKVRQGT